MLGGKIHTYRKEAKKTLNQIAELTGLSASYLSQLERNRIDPSLSALRKIAVALDLPVYLFLEDEPSDEGYVIRKKNRVLMNFTDNSTSYEVASIMPNKRITPAAMLVYFTLKPHTYDTDSFITHEADEISLVTKGELTVLCGSHTVVLLEGDTILIPKNTPHRYYNHTTEEAAGYAVTSPCTWPRSKH